MTVTFSVVVVTGVTGWPPNVKRSVVAQLTTADELIIVASGDDSPLAVSAAAVRLPRATGTSTTVGRRLGAAAATRDIVVFIDDDVTLEANWFERIRTAYASENVAGAAGRLCANGENDGDDDSSEIGRVLADGRLTRNFAAQVGRSVEVDHLPAECFSVRRRVLEAVGGYDDRYGDTGRFAETDIALRARRRGFRLLFVPAASGSRPTPHCRDTLRRAYLIRRGHALMLSRVFGWGQRTGYYLAGALREQRPRLVEAAMLITPYWGRADGSRRPLRRRLQAPLPLLRAAFETAGLISGFSAGVWQVTARISGHNGAC